MNLDQIETKCFILALFIRDDWQRFLLGSRMFEFVDSQLHFTANVYQNDVVEVQGNDGVMLAGQVRRGNSQAFDGYIGDSSVDRNVIEQNRREFFKFFRKNHYYKVVYVLPNGQAIQRRQGFIVEAPEAKELYQLFPKYHISMNFEDINYYNYEEDSEGEEIYGESATLKVATSATGGLIWANSEQGTITEEGTDFSIQNTSSGTTLSSIQLKGDTTQQTYSGKNLCSSAIRQSNNALRFFCNTNKLAKTFSISVDSTVTISGVNLIIYYGSSNQFTVGTADFVEGERLEATFTMTDEQYTQVTSGNGTFMQFYRSNGFTDFGTPQNAQIENNSSVTVFEPYVGGIPAPNPDYPQTVNTVTGEQTITISDDGGNSQSYTVDLGSMELCKIGTYQDYIYKSGSDWYVHKETTKNILDENTVWDSRNVSSEGTTSFRQNSNRYDYPGTGTNSTMAFLPSFIGNAGGATSSYPCFWFQQQGRLRLAILSSDPAAESIDAFSTWLGLHPQTMYSALATATDTQITNANLITQLNALTGATTYNGKTIFTVSSENQLAILRVAVLAGLAGGVVWDEYGATWEEGTGGGPTMIDVDSIDNVYPVWELTGPATNPQISVLNTNTTLSYSGTITASQTLKVDMFNKTATLNGTSVVGNVSGDWVYLEPGINRVTYTTSNADAPDSSIWWQEIVG